MANARILSRALFQFVAAKSWKGAIQVLRQYQTDLVTRDTAFVLGLLIADLRATGDINDAREADYWEVHLMLIEDALRYGVEEVIEELVRHLASTGPMK